MDVDNPNDEHLDLVDSDERDHLTTDRWPTRAGEVVSARQRVVFAEGGGTKLYWESTPTPRATVTDLGPVAIHVDERDNLMPQSSGVIDPKWPASRHGAAHDLQTTQEES
jgi:hypothetical protein